MFKSQGELEEGSINSLLLILLTLIPFSTGHEDKQCRYPASNNNMTPGQMPGAPGDPVMNYAASLATATSPGTNIAAAAHFYQQQVSEAKENKKEGELVYCSCEADTLTSFVCIYSLNYAFSVF